MRLRPVPRQIYVIGILAAAVILMAHASLAATIIEAWGDNSYGELGNATFTSSAVPVVVRNLSGVTAVAGGSVQTLAVQNGGVYAWGENYYGDLGINSRTPSNVPVVVSGPPALSSGVTAIAGGDGISVAVQNGGVYAWGDGYQGALGNNLSIASNVPVAVIGMSRGVTAIAAGADHCLAVQNGAVFAWGYNYDGQLGNNSTFDSSVPVAVSGLSSGVTIVAAGSYHSLAVRNGGLYAWGENGDGELGNNSTTQSNVPVAVSGLSSGVTSIAGGAAFSLAVRDGGVYAWGYNGLGQLGDGTTTNQLTPERIDPTDLTNIIDVAASNYGSSSYALSADGSIWDWGFDANGQLALGADTDLVLTPHHLLPPTGYIFTGISANDEGAEAILTPVGVPEPTSLVLLATVSLALRRRQ